MHVLLIDDSRTMRRILASMLKQMGCQTISEADSGLAALELLADATAGGVPDMVLVDWHMPGMSGVDFVEAVRAKPYDYRGVVMMVTTETEIDQIGRALALGADEYLMKPFTQEVLAQKLGLLGFEV